MIDKTIEDVYADFNNVVSTTYAKVIDQIIVTTNDQTVLFNKYAIRRTDTGYRVASRVTFTEVEFGTSKSALVWAILDHNGRATDCQRVVDLDAKISSIDVELQIHRRIRSSANFERYLILSSKINLNNQRRNDCIVEMKKYTALAKKLMTVIKKS